jgi:hypothetical protein
MQKRKEEVLYSLGFSAQACWVPRGSATKASIAIEPVEAAWLLELCLWKSMPSVIN